MPALFRRFTRIFALLLLAVPAAAQVVTTEPAFPTVDQPVTVFFHAQEGNQGLAGFNGDVYAHTGLITASSTAPNDWKYVVAGWRDTSSPAKFERIDTDLYKLEIADIRAFYSAPTTETILRLAFVFWGVNGGEGKDVGGADIFVDLYEPGLNVRFAQPSSDALNPPFLDPGDTLRVVGVAGAIGVPLDTLQLLVDGVPAAGVAGDTLRYDFVAGAPGRLTLRLDARDAAGQTASDSIIVVVNPAVVAALLPDEVDDGITYNQPGAGDVTLTLDAPGKRFAYVIGEFNDWQPGPAHFMQRGTGADSTRFWLTLSGLAPQTEYAFQYLVDGDLRIADPYAEKVLHPDDNAVSALVYPDLKPYPGDQTQFTVSVLELDRPEYVWQTTDFERPPQHQLVVYELLVRDFSERHTFATVLDSLDYLQRLGVNAIELMPVNEFEFNSSWGYNPSFLFAPDKYYGPADELKRLIDACHARGIAVILDAVLNHAFGRSPFVRLYNEGDFGPPTPDNPWLNPEARHDFNVGYDFNHESAATQGLVDRFNRFWLEEYRIDGYRFDLSKGFTQTFTRGNTNAWGQYDASRVRLLKRMADRIWEVDSTAYVILEHFAVNREELELARHGADTGRPGMMLWGKMTDPYNEATMGYHDSGKSNLSGTYFRTRGWDVPNLVSYMESHDEQRLMFKNLAFGNRSGDYSVQDLPIALERVKAAAAFFFTIPGPKMIWQFGELGYEVDIDFNGRTGEKPIRWGYLQNPLRKKLYDTFAALIHLRRQEPAFHDPATEVELAVSGAVKRIRLTHPTMNVVIVGNFGVTDAAVQGRFHETGRWYDFFSGDSLEVADPNAPVALLPGAFHIYTSRRLPPPKPDLITVDADGEAPPVSAFDLAPAYPNPFRGAATIRFTLPEPGPVHLEAFDLLGRRVALLADETRPPGAHAITWNARGLPAGTYLLRLSAGNRTRTQKLILRP